jgi:hypothetical protein
MTNKFTIRLPDIGTGIIQINNILLDLGFFDHTITQQGIGSKFFDVDLGQSYLGQGDRCRLEKLLEPLKGTIENG